MLSMAWKIRLRMDCKRNSAMSNFEQTIDEYRVVWRAEDGPIARADSRGTSSRRWSPSPKVGWPPLPNIILRERGLTCRC
jgi:hypothetical protein